ncbi:AraC-like DNA-binding protein [Actinoalloteichus hymeniacidonis]|nr:AraC-like DNA-binding protein [Actinoalloteichus hymeniacidonis]
MTDDRVFIAGPDTRSWQSALPPNTMITGLRFQPGQATRALGVPADALRDRRVDLAELWGTHGAALTRRLQDDPDALSAIIAHRPIARPDPELREVLARIDAGATPVSSVIAEIALSERQLRRRFTAAVGYGPATYRRISRLHRAIDRARHATTTSLAEIAAEAGYADQAHLNRDCRELTGRTPATLLRRD